MKEGMKVMAMIFMFAVGWVLVGALIVAMSAFIPAPADTTSLECNCHNYEGDSNG